MAGITLLLNDLASDDPHAPAEVLPLVYNELRQLAAHRLAHKLPGQTLEPTALVREMYLRLVGEARGQNWEGRNHFFAGRYPATANAKGMVYLLGMGPPSP
jgi:hypothetical protein